MTNPISLFSLIHDELRNEIVRRFGRYPQLATPLYRAVFKQGITDFSPPAADFLPPAIRDKLVSALSIPKTSLTILEDAGIQKFATRFSDGTVIESVVIPKSKRTTLCVSSQAGCKMGCTFCMTGSQGFVRDLTVEEIVSQVFTARFTLGHTINNLVFMGMGEPLDNADTVIRAIRVISDQQGLNIPQSRITISTCGHVDGIKRLAEAKIPHVGLAISINSACDSLRTNIMPINRRYPLGLLRQTLSSFPLPKDGVFFIEYVLLAGINDSDESADELCEFLRGLPVRVNLIAYNENPLLPYRSPLAGQAAGFRKRLVNQSLFVRVRQSYGQKIMAACGQLRSATIEMK